ncbi:hypothetical protein ACE6H2_025192 [Prunus campanulata]
MADSSHDSTAISVDHDGNVEWESGSGYYEAGGHRSSRKWPTTKEILGPHEQPANTFLRKWDIVFTISCVFAVFLDPVYPYIPVVDGDRTCYYWDQYLMWSFFGLRSALDLFYAMDIAIFCRRRICSKPNAKTSSKARTILKLLPLVFRALPIPQVVLLTGKYTNFDGMFLLMFFTPTQYTLRVYRTYGLLKQCPNIETEIGRWLKAILDFLPFILASHLYGALWYQLSVQREIDCWWYACQDNSVGCDISHTDYYFYCGEEIYFPNLRLNITHIKASCPINPPNATIFDFGIFLYALQSNMTSSFGSNLQTSTAWSYPANASGSSAIRCLVKGDFYGEELLNWASKLTSFSEFPNSTRIVKAHTKVEAFAIRANNLNIVVSQFWWHFSKRLGHIEESQLERWQHLAACSIQAKWRRRHARPV